MANISYITMIAMLSSTAYLIHTYSLYEKVKNYISLPIKNSRFLLDFIIALVLVSFLERVSFIIIAVCVSNNNILINIPVVIIVSILAILINVWMLIILNKKRKLEWILVIGVLVSYVLVSYFKVATYMKILVMALCYIVSLIGIFKEESLYIAIRRSSRTLITKFRYAGNYFFKVLMNEKIYIINTAMLMILITFLSVIKMENYIVWSMAWAIGSVNTPVLTMMSSDLDIRRHAEMISSENQGVWKMYGRFISIYFVLINLYILILNIVFKNNSLWLNIGVFIVLSIIEVIIAYVLEKRFPILNWQTKQELWKHPRKYVIPLIVFLGMSIVSIITSF